MNPAEKFFENPLFSRWIFDISPETEDYWKNCISKNADETEFLLELKSKMENLKFHEDKPSEDEKLILYHRISKQLEKEITGRKNCKIYLSILKSAAVDILFFSLGGALVYLKMGKKNTDYSLYEFQIYRQIQGSKLILPQGESIALRQSDAIPDYSKPGEIIVNNETVVPQKHPDEESVRNQLINPSVFNESGLEVTLFRKAFFEVQAKNSKPFIVKTPYLEVRVTGIKFNVSAYHEDNIFQTVLKKGRVPISKAGTQLFDKEIILKSNQLTSFNKKTGESVVSDVNQEYYTLWTEGLLSLCNIDSSRIIKKIEWYYNIRGRYKYPLIGRIKIIGKLDLSHDKLEVFEYLEKVSMTRFDKTNATNYELN